MKTAVEWYAEKSGELELKRTQGDISLHELVIELSNLLQQAKEMERQRMIDLVQQLKDYTRESNNVLGFDEREASEFLEIFYNETFKSE